MKKQTGTFLGVLKDTCTQTGLGGWASERRVPTSPELDNSCPQPGKLGGALSLFPPTSLSQSA